MKESDFFYSELSLKSTQKLSWLYESLKFEQTSS